MITGAKAMVSALEAEGVGLVFGYPGANICPFYDCLAESPIRHVLVRNEQNAGHAASGYARISGKTGVCVATSGPGATNLVTAIAAAYMDSIPLVAITGQVSSELLGRDAFQEADITGATLSVTKHRYLVKDARDLPRVFREAFYIASTGRKGPVLIDVPIDVQQAKLEFSCPGDVHLRGYNPNIRGHAIQVKKAAEALACCEKPLILAGGGVFGAGAEETLRAFAEIRQIPVISTMMGLSALPPEHPLCLGMLGAFGTALANRALAESDLLIVAGTRIGERAMTSPEMVARTKTVIHIDIDPAEIGKIMGTSIPIVGDLNLVLGQIAEASAPAGHAAWLARVEELRALCAAPDSDGAFDPVRFLRALTKKMPPRGILVADVGQNQIWASEGFSAKAGRFLTSGGLGAMGYAIPAGIGAALAAPDREVAVVCGDGGFQMALPELATMAQEDVPLKIIVMKNRCLGMIREIQDKKYAGNRFGIELGGLPDLEKLAAAYGVDYLSISENEQIGAVTDAVLKTERAVLVECAVPHDAPTLRFGGERGLRG